jgi:hypothetical protein
MEGRSRLRHERAREEEAKSSKTGAATMAEHSEHIDCARQQQWQLERWKHTQGVAIAVKEERVKAV